MGNFLETLRETQNKPLTNPLLHISLSKIREYLGSFKSVCDTFSIDLIEYDNIFSSNETSFKIWDTDNNGMIDALELFSALILFAEENFQGKVEFLFDIFDFNELGILSLIDLEFLLIQSCNATYKVYGMNMEVQDKDISEFLNNYFREDSEITLPHLIKWVNKVNEIKDFLNLIDKEQPTRKKIVNTQIITLYKNQEHNQDQENNKILNNQKSKPQELGTIIRDQNYKAQVDWLSQICNKLFSLNQDNNKYSQDVYTKIDWVYGFRCSSMINRPLKYQLWDEQKASSEKIIYFTGCIAVIFFPKLCEQQHYTEHDNEIISLAIAKKCSLVATGELAAKPALHIWDSNTLTNLGVIKGFQTNGIHLLSFFKDDDFIASCGLRGNSQIFVYNVKDLSLVWSNYVTEMAIDICTIDNYTEDMQGQQNSMDISKRTIASNIRQDTKEDETQEFISDNSFLVFTEFQFFLYYFENGSFWTQEFQLDMFGIETPIHCATCYKIKNQPQEGMEQPQTDQNSLYVVTGHREGIIVVWKNFDYSFQLKVYDSDIVSICNFKYGVMIATAQGKLHFRDFALKDVIFRYELTEEAFNFKLISYNIVSLTGYQKKIFIVTSGGDVIHLVFKEDRSLNTNLLQRNNYITKLGGDFYAMCILEDQKSRNDGDKILYIGGQQGIVYAFSLELNDLIDMWRFYGEITALDCIQCEKGSFFVVGLHNGLVQVRTPYNEEFLPLFTKDKQEILNCGATISDVKFSSDGNYLIIVCQDNQIFDEQQDEQEEQNKDFKGNLWVYIFNPLDNEFKFKENLALLDNEIPISLDFVDDNRAFLVGTTLRNQFKYDLPDLKKKNLLQETEKINCSVWNIRYSMLNAANEKNKESGEEVFLPIIIGSDVKIFLAAGNNPYIYFWKDKSQLEYNCGGFLKGHSSIIHKLKISKLQDMFFSLGKSDNTVICWKIENQNQLDLPKIVPDEIKQVGESLGITQLDNLNDDVLTMELMYSYTEKRAQTAILQDSFVQFRGINQKQIPIIYKNFIPVFQENQNLMKKPPPLSIKLDYVYGFCSFDKRRSLSYVHVYYNKKEQKKLKGKKLQESQTLKLKEQNQQQKSIMIPSYFQKEMLFAKKQLLPYDEIHENCQRHFVYFVSRIAIVYNPITNRQKFYQGHSEKISCLCTHPMKFIVATGEASIDPKIHIWNVMKCSPFKILKTYHLNGIIQMQFSRDSSLLISISIDKYFSIQVTNWKTEEVIGFRNTGPYQIFDVAFNPYNKYEFVTCGIKNLTIWEINGKNLLRKQVIIMTEQYQTVVCITCLAYISYSLGDKIESDIIAANNNGDLILVTCSKYIIVKEKAHLKMINCIKIIELFQDKVLIITSGEDELIKIWDCRFNIINEINMKNIPNFTDVLENVSFAAQSIDIYQCKYSKKSYEKNEQEENEDSKIVYPILLIGTRQGDILEASFSLEYSGLKSNLGNVPGRQQNIEKNLSQNMSSSESSDNERQGEQNKQKQYEEQFGQNEKFKFDYSLYIQTHGSQIIQKKQKNKKLFFALHPIEKIIATTGDDGQLMIIDITVDKVIFSKTFKQKQASAIKFSPDGELLLIGFIDGTVIVMKIEIKRLANYSLQKFNQLYERPVLKVIQTIEQIQHNTYSNKNSVLNIEFSCSRQKMDESQEQEIEIDQAVYLSISYDCNRKVAESYDSSFVSVYFMQNKPDNNYSEQVENVFVKLFDINCPSTVDIYNKNKVFVGVYFMTFSLDNQFLLLYFQTIESSRTRQNNDPLAFFQVWDIQKKEQCKQLEKVKQSIMSKMNFPNSLVAKYRSYSNLLLNEDIKTENTITAQPIMTGMTKFDNYLICGSQNGDLHFVKTSCLYQKDQSEQQYHQDKFQCLARSYSAHTSFISQIELYDDYLYTTGINDECIMKWQFKQEGKFWDCDNMSDQSNEDSEIEDKYYEVMSEEQFETKQKNILPLRNNIAEAIQNVEQERDHKDMPTELKLINIIGRTAFSRHSNLFYDFEERLIYISGCNLVIHTVKEPEEIDNKKQEDEEELEENPKLQQEFLKLDDSPSSIYAEITCFTLSKDKKIIAAGTSQINAKILIWDICSRTCLKQLTLTNSPYIQGIKFAYDNRHIIVLALTNDYILMLYLIDTMYSIILGCTYFPYSVPFKIKDMEMFPNSIYEFVTCGVQHIAEWSLKGSILSYNNMEIENPKGLVELQKEDGTNVDLDILQVDFITIIFVNETIITAGDQGYLYVWDDKKVIQKQNAHPGVPIMSLHTTQFSNMFVSGGMDGKIIIWELGSSEYSYILEKFYEYDISFNQKLKNIPNSPEKHIQSVCIGNKFILAGTKAGDIYELIRPDESELKSTTKVNQDLVKLRYNCSDHEIPKSVQFSGNSDKIYTLSSSGLFSCWDIKTLTLEYTQHFLLETHSLIVCKKSQIIIIAFEQEVIFLDSFNKSYPVKNNCLKFKANIADIKLSYDEDMLVVALDPNQEENACIYFFAATGDDRLFSDRLEDKVVSLVTALELIDFSTDNFYLVYKDHNEEVVIIDISNINRVNISNMEFDIEWCTDGIKVNEKTKGVNTYYSDENKILKICKLSQRSIAVTDQMGSIRLFNYPCKSAAGIGYYAIYTDHLNIINQCVISPDKKYLVTSSEIDRCVMIWRVLTNDEEVEQEEDNQKNQSPTNQSQAD